MKVAVYSRRSDEAGFFDKFAAQYGVELSLTKEAPSLENVSHVEGCRTVSIITSPVDAALLDRFYAAGVRYLSTRTIGYDHIDVVHAKELGIHVGNVNYSENSVADYTVMLAMMATRRIKLILNKAKLQDYSLRGVRGRELHNLTVGVVGTGRIGRTVLQRFSGFGCRLLCCDLFENEEAKRYASYTDLETLLRESDVVTLHMPATEENFHMLGKKAFSLMKRDAVLVNTGRGSLVDTEALIDALEAEEIGGAALDVLENESEIYYESFVGRPIPSRQLALLDAFPNVLLTPHTAFYTDQAVSDMVENSIKSCILFEEGRPNPWQVI